MSYPAKKIYDIIADIESYPKFIPGCTSAKITSYSKEDEHFKQKWPQEATLGIGYGDSINEKFTSRVYCVPPVSEQGRAGMGYVEAVSGEAEHQMDEGFVEHHTESSSSASQKDSPMEFLRTRWTVKAYPFKPAPPSGIGYAAKDGEKKKEEESQPAHEVCDVTLSIQYKFRNPVYDMMSKAVAPKMADKMVEAFEKRVRKLLD
jgi:coenzyme Q-binding protein COQ10